MKVNRFFPFVLFIFSIFYAFNSPAIEVSPENEIFCVETSIKEESKPLLIDKPLPTQTLDISTAIEISPTPKPITDYDLAYEIVKEYTNNPYANVKLSEEEIQQYSKWFVDYSKENDLSYITVIAMAWFESEFNKDEVSHSDAIGIMQIKPSTAKPYGVTREDLFDPETNIRTGVKYLADLRDDYNLDLETAITAYNQGIGRVSRGTAKGIYIRKVNEISTEMNNLIEKRMEELQDDSL